MILELHLEPPVFKSGGTNLRARPDHRQDRLAESSAKDLRAVARLLGSELRGRSFREKLSLSNDRDSRTKLFSLGQILQLRVRDSDLLADIRVGWLRSMQIEQKLEGIPGFALLQKCLRLGEGRGLAA